VLSPVVQRHLQSWLAEGRERDPDSVPIAPYIEREPRGYLTQSLIDQSLRSVFLISINVTTKGSFTHSRQLRRFRLAQSTQMMSYLHCVNCNI
jgi:hypothetical protein